MSLHVFKGGLWGNFITYIGYQNIYNVQFIFGTQIIVEL